MKRIEKEYTRIEKEISYEAWDGETFSKPEDCIEYENNARGVIAKKVQDFQVTKGSEYDLFFPFGVGSDDYAMEIYKPTSTKDIDNLNQYMNMFDPSTALVREEYIGKVLILRFNYDKDWVRAQTLDEMIEEFRKNFSECILKEEKKSE